MMVWDTHLICYNFLWFGSVNKNGEIPFVKNNILLNCSKVNVSYHQNLNANIHVTDDL